MFHLTDDQTALICCGIAVAITLLVLAIARRPLKTAAGVRTSNRIRSEKCGGQSSVSSSPTGLTHASHTPHGKPSRRSLQPRLTETNTGSLT